GRAAFPPIGELPYLLTLPAHGFYWFRLATDAEAPSWHEEFLPAEDRPVLVLFDGWNSLFREQVVPWRIGMAVKTRAQFETDTLPRYIETQRWYASKGATLQRARIAEHALWEDDAANGWLLALLEVEGPSEAATYFAPLAMAWEEQEEERARGLSAATGAVARVRQQADMGVIGDAFADEQFCHALVRAIAARKELPAARGRIHFTPTSAFRELAGEDLHSLPVGRPRAQSSNTLVLLGERLFVKGYRRLRTGVNPEYEIGRYLTEVANFAHCVPVAGVVEHRATDGARTTLAMVQAYVPNQGDGWDYTQDYLIRHFEQARDTVEPMPPDVHGAYLELMQTLGRRTAELHLAFAMRTGDPAFEPEPLDAADVQAYVAQLGGEARRTLDVLQAGLDRLDGPALEEAQAVLAMRARIEQRISQSAALPQRALKTRYHGDYHLAQVLIARNDVVIIDFEGEPGRSFEERRAKHSPLRDVAGMLRSFGYAGASALKDIVHNDDERDALLPLAREWETQVRAAFLRAYEERAAGAGLFDELVPGQGLLGLFELHKALYELRYEIDNRPDWVRIPLQGIAALMGGSERHGAQEN
ncbi:MAG: putative maltokinase, partial [Methylibium sp.]|nr:putative maltokinase [Methylibium sp.]